MPRRPARRPARHPFLPRPAAQLRAAAATAADPSERLEERLVLAGNVTATVANGTLFVTGDDAGNGFTVSQVRADAGTYEVRPDFDPVVGAAGTTVNGSGDTFVATGVTQFLVIRTGAGNDDVAVVGQDSVGPAGIAGGVYVETGAGDDAVRLTGLNTAGYVAAVLGFGNDTLQSGRAGLGGPAVDPEGIAASEFFVFGGFGNDAARVVGTRTTGDFAAVMGEGDDAFETANLRVTGNFFFYGQGGADAYTSTGDTLNASGAAGAFAFVSGGDDADRFAFSDLTVAAGTTLLDLGVGADVVTSTGGTFAGPLFVYLGRDTDTLTLTGNTYLGTTVFSGDAGIDVLIDGGGNVSVGPGAAVFPFDFEN